MSTQLAMKPKRVSVTLHGDRVVEVEVMPGTQVQDLVAALHLDGGVPWNVSGEGGELLASETDLYSRVRPGERLYVGPSAPVGIA